MAVDFFVREPLGLIRGDGRTMEDEKTEMREYRFLFDNDNHAAEKFFPESEEAIQ